jgi:hypothetical protein
MKPINYFKTCELLKNVDFFWQSDPSYKGLFFEAQLTYLFSSINYIDENKEAKNISVKELISDYELSEFNSFVWRLKSGFKAGKVFNFVFYTSRIIEILKPFENYNNVLNMFNYSGNNLTMIHIEYDIDTPNKMLINKDHICKVARIFPFNEIGTYASCDFDFKNFVEKQIFVKDNTIFKQYSRIRFYSLIPISFQGVMV